MEELLISIGTILGVVAIHIFRDMRDGKHLFKKNGAYESQQVLKKILTSQEELQHHFNHDTTILLTEIRDNTKETNKTIERHALQEEGFQQKVRDFISRASK